MKQGSALQLLRRRASPGAVIGVPACTAYTWSNKLVKNAFLHLAKNIPEREAEPRNIAQQLAVGSNLGDRLP